MAGYNYAEIAKMQNDAMQRVDEMRITAERVAAQANSELNSPPGRSYTPQKGDKPRHVQMPDDYIQDLRDYAKRAKLSPYVSEKPDNSLRQLVGNLSSGASDLPGFFKNALSELNIDSDRALLLSLILLLSEEKKDNFLVIALLYMML